MRQYLSGLTQAPALKPFPPLAANPEARSKQGRSLQFTYSWSHPQSGSHVLLHSVLQGQQDRDCSEG
jgi:hypothetical protein